MPFPHRFRNFTSRDPVLGGCRERKEGNEGSQRRRWKGVKTERGEFFLNYIPTVVFSSVFLPEC